jgi:hypothetical protein
MQTSILKMTTSQTTEYYIIPEVSKLLAAPSPEAQVGPLRVARLSCMRYIFILNCIWAQHKMHILLDSALLTYFAYHLVIPALAPNYGQKML